LRRGPGVVSTEENKGLLRLFRAHFGPRELPDPEKLLPERGLKGQAGESVLRRLTPIVQILLIGCNSLMLEPGYS